MKLWNCIKQKLHSYVWRRWFWDGSDGYKITLLTAEEMRADKVIIFPIDPMDNGNL